MIDEVNRTLLAVAVIAVVGVFAANAICSDTNAEVVDLDQSAGGVVDPAVSFGRGAEILARRADGLAALPRPSASVSGTAASLCLAEAVVLIAGEILYRVGSTVGYLTLHVRGPGESEARAGIC